MIHVLFEKNGVLSVKEKLQMLALPPKQRARLLWRVAAKVRDGSKTNIRRQQTPEGNKWAKRKQRRGDRRKLLSGLMPLIVASDKQSNADKAVVTFKGWAGSMKSGGQKKQYSGLIANTHQKGKTQFKSSYPPNNRRDPKSNCTRKEAKFLKNLNFSVWARRVNPAAKQGKRVKPPAKWIVDNVTYKEFRHWVHMAREQAVVSSKTSWRIPARKFLGLSKEKYRKAWERAIQGINYGWQVKAQDMK